MNEDSYQDKAWNALRATGDFVWEGVSSSVDAAGYAVFTDEACEELLQKERRLRKEYEMRVLNRKERWRHVDAITIGGLLLADALSGTEIPATIEAAYHGAYPHEAASMSFADKISSLDDYQIPGFLAGIKGKLFELQYVDLLNNELLPDGYQADLATSPTQPGWDIAIQGPEGNLELIQAKATDSVAYVNEAFEKYPEFDIVTTDEVYGQMLMSGAGTDLINSGITNAGLESQLDEAVNSGLEFDWTPPLLGMAVIGFTTWAYEDGPIDHKARVMGRRCGRSYPAWMVGHALNVFAGPLWFMSIPAGMGVRYLAEAGRIRRERWADLRRRVKSYESVLSRYRKRDEQDGVEFVYV
ncbi:MAG: hypothetical protein H8E43_00035 [Planctomycetia bacterium]|nr:hypothetical protein [Planctomycetia bacterium]